MGAGRSGLGLRAATSFGRGRRAAGSAPREAGGGSENGRGSGDTRTRQHGQAARVAVARTGSDPGVVPAGASAPRRRATRNPPAAMPPWRTGRSRRWRRELAGARREIEACAPPGPRCSSASRRATRPWPSCAAGPPRCWPGRGAGRPADGRARRGATALDEALERIAVLEAGTLALAAHDQPTPHPTGWPTALPRRRPSKCRRPPRSRPRHPAPGDPGRPGTGRRAGLHAVVDGGAAPLDGAAFLLERLPSLCGCCWRKRVAEGRGGRGRPHILYVLAASPMLNCSSASLA